MKFKTCADGKWFDFYSFAWGGYKLKTLFVSGTDQYGGFTAWHMPENIIPDEELETEIAIQWLK